MGLFKKTWKTGIDQISVSQPEASEYEISINFPTNLISSNASLLPSTLKVFAYEGSSSAYFYYNDIYNYSFNTTTGSISFQFVEAAIDIEQATIEISINYNISNWSGATPYIYDGTTWKKYKPKIYSSSQWKDNVIAIYTGT